MIRSPFLRPTRALCVAATLLALACHEESPPPPAATGLLVRAENHEHFPHYYDFGKVPHGQRVEHTFRIDNGDPKPVTVMSVQTACQCTRLKSLVARDRDGNETEGDPSRDGNMVVIPPGGELDFTLLVDTGMLRKPNARKLSVVRMRNDSSTPFLTFEMQVLPQKLFQLNPPEIRLTEIPIDHGQSTPIRVLRGHPSFEANVISVETNSPRLTATLDQQFHYEDPIWTVNLSFGPGEAVGPFREEVVLITTDDEGREGPEHRQRLVVPVYGTYVENVRLYPRALDFGQVPASQGARIDAHLKSLVPGARVKVLAASLTGAPSELRVVCNPKAEDSQGRSPEWEILLHADPGLAPGPLSGTLRLELDDSQTAVIERPFRGHVLPAD